VVDLTGARVDRDEFELVAAQVPDPVGKLETRIAGSFALAAAPSSYALSSDPLIAAAGTLVGTFAGRLDNRRQLFQRLRIEGSTELSDSQLLLAAVARWGERCAEQFLGDFVFLVWDAAHARLLCGRDQLGIKPLYYQLGVRDLAVATEVRSIVRHPRLPPCPNERFVKELLLGGQLANDTDTLYADVQRLPAGHVMTARDRSITSCRYWDVELEPDPTLTGEDAVRRFLAVFSDAVACRCRDVAPVVSLSGGLDSSLVAAIAAGRGHVARQPGVTTWSTVFPGEACDEQYWIDAMNESARLSSRRLEWAPSSWDDLLEQARRDAYLPPYPNSSSEFFVRRGLRDTRLLTGLGGDQWMNGYDLYFRDLVVGCRWKELAAAIRLGHGPTIAGVVRDAVAARWPRRHDTDDRQEDLAWLGAELRSVDTPPIARAVAGAPAKSAATRHASLHDTWLAHMIEMDALVAGRGGVGVAMPFLDRRVVEFAFALPESERWRGDDRRSFERRVLRGRVPAAIEQRRGKAEFSIEFIRQIEALRFPERLGDLEVGRRGWVDVAGLTEALRSSGADPATVSLYSLWAVAALEAWVRGSPRLR
jgi:asparagine synthase (glutamine-hydrolysing)